VYIKIIAGKPHEMRLHGIEVDHFEDDEFLSSKFCNYIFKAITIYSCSFEILLQEMLVFIL
jgi:hypothetical protein